MSAIVCNTLTGAVSEYTNFAFHGITPTHAGSATGLFLLGGDTDLAELIVSRVQTGQTAWKSGMKKTPGTCFFGLQSEGDFEMFVHDGDNEWSYQFTAPGDGSARASPGRGLRSNYFSFGLSNADGQAFELDYIHAELFDSKTRRT
jgi:hypothetical protein